MKKLKFFMFSLLMCFTAVLVTACNKKPATVTSVELQGLKQFYNVEESIDFSQVKLKVNYSNKKSKTYTKAEFDLADGTEPKSTTEFVLYTDGLYAQVQDGQLLPKGTFNLKVLLVENNTKYDEIGTVKSVTIDENLSRIYTLDEFSTPKNFENYKKYADPNNQNTEEAKFKHYEQKTMVVGDDNPIEIKPQFSLIHKTNQEVQNEDTIDLALNVVVKNADGVVQDQTIYTFENGLLDFTEEAIGKTYTITVTPADFDDATKTFDLTLKVEDGFNIQHAYELGILNIIDDTTRKATDWYSNYDQSLKLFYKGNQEWENRDYYAVWEPFLIEKGMDKKYIKEVSNIFILNDLDVTREDIPDDYFVLDAEESGSDYAVGYLRDWSTLYHHFMTQDFSLNGNYFTLSFASVPLCRNQQESDGNGPKLFFQSKEDAAGKYFPGHAAAFAFVGADCEGQYNSEEEVSIINLNTIGNADGGNYGKDENGNLNDDALELGESLIFVRGQAAPVNMNNNIIKNFFVSYFPESYNNAEHEAEIYSVKIFDSFSNAVYSWGAIYSGKFNDCEIRRAGGPAILLVPGATSNALGAVSITFEQDKNIIESYINGQEPWFNLVGATALAPLFPKIEQGVQSVSYGTKTAYQTHEGRENLINCICVSIDCDYLDTDRTDLKTIYKYNTDTFATEPLYTEGTFVGQAFSMNASQTNLYVLTITNMAAQDPSAVQNSGKLGLVIEIKDKAA